MDTIDVTDIDLVEFAKAVYELSSPQGMGFLHARSGQLPDEDARELVGHCRDDSYYALDMDYVHGRACKMHVRRKDGKLLIDSPWYDHTNGQLQDLLKRFDITVPGVREHGIACNCQECR